MTLQKQKATRVSATRRKRTAQHHKRSQQYAKPYWPYLPIIAVLLTGFITHAWLGASGRGVLGYATNISVDGLAAYTNTERTARSLGALAVNATLNQAAQAKANDMVANNYWSHNSPGGATPWTFIQNAGYAYLSAGENLAYGFNTSADTVVGWMNSPSHRDNMLNADFKEVGFGIANSANYQGSGPETIVVAMYANPVGAPAPAPEPAPAPAPVTLPAPTQPTQPKPNSVQSQSNTAKTAPQQTDEPVPPAEELKPEQLQPAALPKNITQRGDTPIRQQQADTIKPQRVSRVSIMTKTNAVWSTFVVSLIACAALGMFLARHTRAWHKFLLRGERFIIHHPLVDTLLIGLAVICFMLVQATGVIR